MHITFGAMMRRIATAYAALAVLLSLGGCRDIALPPAGSYSEVLLVTEDGLLDRWNDAVSPLLTAENDYVTSMEPSFDVKSIRAVELEDFPTVKNILLCGVLDSGTEIGRRIMGLLGPDGAASVARGQATILKKDNLPAPGQLTLIVTAGSHEALQKVIDARGEEIVDIIENSCRERLRHHLLRRSNTVLSQELFKKYGFALQVPYLYRLLSDAADPPGIELMREPPTRILGIFWVDTKDPPTIHDRDALFDIRADYVWKRYDHDRMDRDRVRYTMTRLGKHEAVRMSGYWENANAVAGGYFETYYIFDDSAELLWAVDLLTFAPGKPKHPLVRELRAIAETIEFD